MEIRDHFGQLAGLFELGFEGVEGRHHGGILAGQGPQCQFGGVPGDGRDLDAEPGLHQMVQR